MLNTSHPNPCQCAAFAKAQDTLLCLLHTTTKIDQETSHLRYAPLHLHTLPCRAPPETLTRLPSQPPDATTIQAHVRRLREYNEIKVIGQQLIGLVAENRGVPVRALYETGEFGVGMPH